VPIRARSASESRATITNGLCVRARLTRAATGPNRVWASALTGAQGPGSSSNRFFAQLASFFAHPSEGSV
jgi:hypothetical protein